MPAPSAPSALPRRAVRGAQPAAARLRQCNPAQSDCPESPTDSHAARQRDGRLVRYLLPLAPVPGALARETTGRRRVSAGSNQEAGPAVRPACCGLGSACLPPVGRPPHWRAQAVRIRLRKIPKRLNTPSPSKALVAGSGTTAAGSASPFALVKKRTRPMWLIAVKFSYDR